MQQRPTLSDREINHDLLRFVRRTPLWFWPAFLGLGFMTLVMLSTTGNMIYWGLVVTGLNRPTYWAVFITNFVYWVGISHAGVMMSAILRLTHAEWRRPLTRAAEVLTVFSLLTAAFFPLIHTGRPWRTLYWIFPYDVARGIWPTVRSPLIWDPAAVFTYLIASSLVVYHSLIPDLAILRGYSSGRRRAFYSALSLGFRGTPRQWRMHSQSALLLAAMILAVFVTVHSIVSWDFGMPLVPGWHSTALAPYFVLGAMHSGIAALVITMVLIRRYLRADRYLTPDHFDAIGRLQIAVALAWIYFFMLDFMIAVATQESRIVETWQLRLFTWPYTLVMIIFIATALVIPLPLWLFRKVRRNPAAMFWLSLSVNVGLWLERYTIIVPSLVYKQTLTFTWAAYTPSPTEIIITAGSFFFAGLGIFLFSKVFPIVPVFSQKEAQILRSEIAVGRREVPAIIRE